MTRKLDRPTRDLL